MTKGSRGLYFVAAVLTAALTGSGYMAYRYRAPTPALVERHLNAWQQKPRAMAALMTERYGLPSALGRGIAVWHGRGPWKRIVVHGDSPDSYLEQVVAYWAPPDTAVFLDRFGHGLSFDPAREELTVKSGDESLNFLALNLADRVASGKSTAEEARKIYERTASLSAAGKSSPLTETLLFAPHPTEPVEPWSSPIEY